MMPNMAKCLKMCWRNHAYLRRAWLIISVEIDYNTLQSTSEPAGKLGFFPW
jgi:hypothetical protein